MSRARGMIVALVGADGAGKTTVARRIERSTRLSARYVYMGLNPAASNYMLPTTRAWIALQRRLGREVNRGGPPEPAGAARPARTAAWKRPLVAVKGLIGLLHRTSEEWYRQLVAWRLRRAGHVVVFDRHFYWDYFSHDIHPRGGVPLHRKLHGWLLARCYPRPEHVIVLDAPAEVLFARKPEGTLRALQSRRQEYLDLYSQSDRAHLIDVSRPLEEVATEIEALLQRLLEARDA